MKSLRSPPMVSFPSRLILRYVGGVILSCEYIRAEFNFRLQHFRRSLSIQKVSVTLQEPALGSRAARVSVRVTGARRKPGDGGDGGWWYGVGFSKHRTMVVGP